MVVKSPDTLQCLAGEILQAAGADRRNAEGVADHLVAANLCGVDTHGIIHVPIYVSDMQAGQIVPTAWPTIERQGSGFAHVHGRWTFGQIVAKVAMETAIEKATANGIAIVTCVQSHHIGRLGYYGEMAAAAGMVSMILGGGYCRNAPRAVPFGGRDKILDTNPVAMAFPMDPDGSNDPVMFDFATTATSGVKIANAHRRGEKVPEGCIVDNAGHPTTDPNDYMDGGAFTPFGGHKGYALMFAAEVLGRVFGDADHWADAQRGSDIFRNQGVTMIVFKADLMGPDERYRHALTNLVDQTRATRPAPGFERVMVPGDPERTTRVSRQREGIPVADDIWSAFVKTAASVGVQIDP